MPRLSPESERARVLMACLTKRERQVAEGFAAGKDKEAIAAELGILMVRMDAYLAHWKLKDSKPADIARIVLAAKLEGSA